MSSRCEELIARLEIKSFVEHASVVELRNGFHVDVVLNDESYEQQVREMAGDKFAPREAPDGIDLRFRDEWQTSVARSH